MRLDWYDDNSNRQLLTAGNPEQTNLLVMILNNIIIPEVEDEQCNITILLLFGEREKKSSSASSVVQGARIPLLVPESLRCMESITLCV